MKRLFIHNLLFRLLSPFAIGALVYLLILLINNNVEQIEDYFLGQELYVCIGLAFIIQEFSRLSTIVFKRATWFSPFFLRSVLQFLLALVITVFLVTIAMNIYFRYFMSYSPNTKELLIFNVLFSLVTMLYWLLYAGHQLLNMINTEQLAKQEFARRQVRDRFSQFKDEINTELLFQNLEGLIVLMKKDKDAAEDLTNKIASLYRYTLLKRDEELVPIEVELESLRTQNQIYNKLPFRKVKLSINNELTGHVVPLTFLKVFEKIMKSTIVDDEKEMVIEVNADESGSICISYEPEDKLGSALSVESMTALSLKYDFYSDQRISITEQDDRRMIQIPKLILQ